VYVYERSFVKNRGLWKRAFLLYHRLRVILRSARCICDIARAAETVRFGGRRIGGTWLWWVTEDKAIKARSMEGNDLEDGSLGTGSWMGHFLFAITVFQLIEQTHFAFQSNHNRHTPHML